jgi:hypothetical protein
MKPQKAFVIPLSIIIIAMLIALGGYVYLQGSLPPVVSEPLERVACTMDAMQCPDGSYVGRTGANCEFVCPDIATSTGTSTATSTSISTSTSTATSTGSSTNPIINSIPPNS